MITITTSEIDYFKREPYKKERLAFTKHGNKLKLIKLKKGQRYPTSLVYEHSYGMGIVRLADPRKYHITDFAAKVTFGQEGCTNRCDFCNSWESCEDFFYAVASIQREESGLPYIIYFCSSGKYREVIPNPPHARVDVGYLRLLIPVILSPTDPYIPKHIWDRVLHKKPIKCFSAVKKFLVDNYNKIINSWNQGCLESFCFGDGDNGVKEYCKKHKQEFLQWKED